MLPKVGEFAGGDGEPPGEESPVLPFPHSSAPQGIFPEKNTSTIGLPPVQDARARTLGATKW